MYTSWRNVRLKEECGVSADSFHNAQELVKAHGRPWKLDFRADKRKADYFVHASWADGFKFCFTGFSWGYGGTGPHYMDEFLKLIGAKIDYPVIQSMANTVTEERSFEASMIPFDQFGVTDCTLIVEKRCAGCAHFVKNTTELHRHLLKRAGQMWQNSYTGFCAKQNIQTSHDMLRCGGDDFQADFQIQINEQESI